MKYQIFFVVLITDILFCSTKIEQKNEQNEDYQYWQNLGLKELDNARVVFENLNSNIAKNIILFIGDGMSLTTLTASRIYKAQFKGRKIKKHVKGEESHLTFQKFPHVALSKTYSVDRQTPDSASTASAMYSGVKTNGYTMGYDNSIIHKNVSSQLSANEVDTIFQWALNADKDVGFVTTSRVSHATPAALYAHVASRDYECDKKLPPESPKKVKDITHQLVHNDPGRRAKVVMGGGIKSWISKAEYEKNWRQAPYYDYDHTEFSCERLDNENLIDTFMRKNKTVPGFENMQGKFVKSREELLNLDVSSTDYLLGLFSDTHMQYEDIRSTKYNPDQPSLSEMTEVAIKMLKKNTEKGFFIMIEQSNIDHAHHNNRATASLHETMVLDEAVEKALSLVDSKDTLVIVTSDHSHTMSMGGYQSRGSDIRGLVDNVLAGDGLPYTILSYANGPSFASHFFLDNSTDAVTRQNLTGRKEFYESFAFQNPSLAPRSSETHGGDDVGIFALGPFSHMFHSVHEQSYIAHVMAYASCIGPHQNAKHCVVENNSNILFSSQSCSLIIIVSIFIKDLIVI